ncbi:MAG: 50S ribosomal protein L13 [Chloroflexi bacterium]|jgi:large subunit ribosomal protein L13|nr:50S ribosomal protein L13 [Chloroflexota bacterium]
MEKEWHHVKTYALKASEIDRQWFVVDAEGQNLGRLATRIATVLRGKHKPTFTPSMDMGDFVIVVNADKVTVTGGKLDDKKYYRYSGYPGGLRETTLRTVLSKHPTRVLEAAVRGMLPKNRLGRQMIKKLKVYAGATHPHAAQQPKELAV